MGLKAHLAMNFFVPFSSHLNRPYLDFVVPTYGIHSSFLGFPRASRISSTFELGGDQCWAKSLAPTGNFPASYEPNRNLKILTGHFPTCDNVNRNMLNFFFSPYLIK